MGDGGISKAGGDWPCVVCGLGGVDRWTWAGRGKTRIRGEKGGKTIANLRFGPLGAFPWV